MVTFRSNIRTSIKGLCQPRLVFSSMVHIGQKIEETLREKGMSVMAFSKKIKRSRNVVYDIFNRTSIDTELLLLICKALETDFFKLYSERLQTKKANENEYTSTAVAEPMRPLSYSLSEEILILRTEFLKLQNEIQILKKKSVKKNK
jgi:lambda repressor-like predicted transcriptional regulator